MDEASSGSGAMNSSDHGVTDNGLGNFGTTYNIVPLQPRVLKDCLRKGGSEHISAMSADIRLGEMFADKDGNSGNEERTHNISQPAEHNYSHYERSQCLLKLSVPAGLVLKLTLEFCSEITLQAYELLRADGAHDFNNSKAQSGTPVYKFRGQNTPHSFLNTDSSPARLFPKESQTAGFTNSEDETAAPRLETRALLIHGCDAWYPPSHVFSQTSTVWLALEDSRNDTRKNLGFLLRFAAVEKSEAAEYQLEVVYTSPTTGYVQTPGWDGTTTQYRRLMRSCATFTAPEGHVIFLSFLGLVIVSRDCEADEPVDDKSEHLILYAGTCSYGSIVIKKHCQFVLRRPRPYVHKEPSASLSLYFVSNNESEPESFGFKAQFSFHKPGAMLEKKRKWRWNCSTSFWADFEHHFPCDLVSQCVGGEDEADCPYTGSRCGLGQFQVREKCYQYLEMPYFSNTWEKANLRCNSRGSTLASLETQQEWNDVIQLLSRYGDFFVTFIGLKTPENDALSMIYRNAWQWQSGVIAYQLDVKGAGALPFCASLTSPYFRSQNPGSYLFHAANCGRLAPRLNSHFVCELPSDHTDSSANADSPSSSSSPQQELSMVPSSAARSRKESTDSAVQLVACPQGHLTYTFAACAAESACWTSSPERGECKAPMTPLPPSFQCADGLGSVPYTLVCDFRQDCRDSSDENFCDFPPCVGNMLPCGDSGQCYTREASCDFHENCFMGTDEAGCNKKRMTLFRVVNPPPPAVVMFSSASEQKLKNRITVRPLSSPGCPAAHFQCPGGGYCLPVFVRCNGVQDCPGREDEAECDSYTCPGFYRCRGSRICIDVENMCDVKFHCPQHDDELLCGLTCPDACTCQGLGFFCRRKFSAEDHPSIRFLEARGTGMSLGQVANNTFLVHLGLGDCKVQELSLIRLTRLHSLDLSDNNLLVVDMRYLKKLKHLRKLVLAGNPLAGFTTDDVPSFVLVSRSLHDLDLSRTLLRSLNENTANVLTNLRALNFSHSRLDSLDSFEALVNLRVLDVRGSSLAEFQPNVLRVMHDLNWMYADNPKLCCSDILPAGFNLNRCFAPMDEISSCKALLRSVAYRVALALFAVLTLLGNLFCFVYRVRLPPSVKKLGFNVFVTQLCLSDFLMGVYLAVIGVADRAYLGSYLWKDVAWKSSAACKMAGFFSLLSSETSAIIVSLITVDRFIVIRFPFSRVRFVGRSAYVASGLSWFLGLLLASVPLLPVTRHWNFYSQTEICIPLPITRKEFPGHSYSFGVMIVCNLVLFLLIAAGQALIYWSVQANTMTSATDSSSKAKDARIARGLIIVVMSDFLCWFPIGLCGVLSFRGYLIPGEVNVAMAIFVLPLNSALNPFLYTLNLVLEKRQKIQEERIKKFLLSKFKTGELAKV